MHAPRFGPILNNGTDIVDRGLIVLFFGIFFLLFEIFFAIFRIFYAIFRSSFLLVFDLFCYFSVFFRWPSWKKLNSAVFRSFLLFFGLFFVGLLPWKIFCRRPCALSSVFENSTCIWNRTCWIQTRDFSLDLDLAWDFLTSVV